MAISISWWQSSVVFSQVPGVGGKRSIDIASINLYVGSDFSPVTTLDPSDRNFNLKLISGVATIYSHIVATDFRTRADALAREIAERAPDLIGLQEAALLRRQSPGDSIVGGTTPATRVELDYVAILLDALARRGAHYAVAAQVQDVDVELPLVTGPNSFDDLRFTDRDVVLARTDLPPGQLRVLASQGTNFAASVPLPIGVNVLRGWTSVDVQVRGRLFRFVNTHVEDLALYRGSQFRAIHAETVDPNIGVKPPLWFSDHAGLFATLAIN